MGSPKRCLAEESSQPVAHAFQQPEGTIFSKSFLIHSRPLRLSRGKGDLCALHFSQKTCSQLSHTLPTLPKIMETRSFCLVCSRRNPYFESLMIRTVWTPLFFLSPVLHLMAGRWCVPLHLCTASLLQVRLLSTAWRTAVLHLGESELEREVCWIH